jgi:oligopeptide transport system substrate-binding protein
VVDWAAERHEVSADGLTYTFHLHKGMQWSDGIPIDANTFAYSINRSLDPCINEFGSTSLDIIKGAEAFVSSDCADDATKSATTLIGSALLVPDPLTLQIKLEHQAGYFLAYLTAPAAWGVPQALVERYTQPSRGRYGNVNTTVSTWTDHLTDNGPFGGNLFTLISKEAPNGPTRYTFERNEHFWGQKPLLRRLEYTLYKDTGVAWDAYKSGVGDVGYPPTAEWDIAKTLKGTSFHQTPMLAFSYLVPNWRQAPFDDVRVRNAFSLALDRQAIAHDVFKDASQPTIHLVPEGMPGYNPDLADAAGRRGKDALTPDLATARSLANAYGAEKCDGDLSKCPPVVFTIRPNRPNTALVIQAMQRQWQTAFPGWPITLASIEEWLAPRGLLKNVQFRNDAWGADYPDPQDFLSLLWTTTNAPTAYNQSGVSIPEVDRLCDQADTMMDQTARIALYQRAEQLLVDQGAALPVEQSLRRYVVRLHVADWGIAPMYVTPLPVWQATYLRR